MSVNHSARSGGIIGIYFYFLNMKVYCVLSLESPHRGDSNEYNAIYNLQYVKENKLKLSKNCSYWIFFKGLKDEFETDVVNEPSVFEPLQSYCIL